MIELRDLDEADSDRLFRWRREPEVDRWMSAALPPDPDMHRRWFAALMEDPDRCGWVVVWAGEPVGFLMLSGLMSIHRRAEWGWYIGEAPARGRGVGRAAQALGLDRAFAEHAVDKVWSEVLAANEIALKAQAAAGFRREGYLRRHVVKQGQVQDVVVLGILKEEWAARRVAVLRDLVSGGFLPG